MKMWKFEAFCLVVFLLCSSDLGFWIFQGLVINEMRRIVYVDNGDLTSNGLDEVNLFHSFGSFSFCFCGSEFVTEKEGKKESSSAS